ncbi:MAG: hypothetical protein IPF41_13000 [Flavobacteriales bacterium]|nr:hypothetical protein [Flavobacteriales bacterium]
MIVPIRERLRKDPGAACAAAVATTSLYALLDVMEVDGYFAIVERLLASIGEQLERKVLVAAQERGPAHHHPRLRGLLITVNRIK